MDDPLQEHARRVRARFQRALNLSLAFLVLIGAIFFVLPEPGVRTLSVRPGDWSGLWGVVTAPLLHGSFGHLAANGFALLVLGTLAGTVYPLATLRALPLAWAGSGLAAWSLGADGSFHLGASGVTHGLGFLLFTLGALRRDRPAIAAGMIAFLLFGGMVLGVLPQEPGVSWQSHLGGAGGGLLAALLWRRLDPTPPRPLYSWELEAETPLPDGELEPPAPASVPVLWQRPAPPATGVILPFRARPPGSPPGDPTPKG